MQTITDGVFRLGSRWVNFYIVEEGGALTLIDTGFPGYVDQVPSALTSLDREPSAVKAIVLTHTHADHIGGAEQLSKLTGAPVLVNRGESEIALGKAKPGSPKGFASSLWRPRLLAFVGHGISNKGAARITVPEVTTFEPDDVLDVPGKLRVVYSPGHSPAHSALALEARRVLFCGDAMATLAVNTGSTGPQLHPFNEDRDEAIRSLDAVASVDADLVLPGHGEPWRGSPRDAVDRARERL